MAALALGMRLTLAQACARTGLTRSAMYRLIRARRIAFVQDGPSAVAGRRGPNYYFYERDLQAYLESVRREVLAPAVTEVHAPGRLSADVSDLIGERRLS